MAPFYFKDEKERVEENWQSSMYFLYFHSQNLESLCEYLCSLFKKKRFYFIFWHSHTLSKKAISSLNQILKIKWTNLDNFWWDESFFDVWYVYFVRCLLIFCFVLFYYVHPLYFLPSSQLSSSFSPISFFFINRLIFFATETDIYQNDNNKKSNGSL